MKTEPLNLIMLNETLVDIYMSPANDWHLWNEAYKPDDLNLTWVVDTYEGDLLKINLTFFKPSQISPTEVFDTLVFHIMDRSFYFIADRELVDLHQNYTTLSAKVKR